MQRWADHDGASVYTHNGAFALVSPDKNRFVLTSYTMTNDVKTPLGTQSTYKSLEAAQYAGECLLGVHDDKTPEVEPARARKSGTAASETSDEALLKARRLRLVTWIVKGLVLWGLVVGYKTAVNNHPEAVQYSIYGLGAIMTASFLGLVWDSLTNRSRVFLKLIDFFKTIAKLNA